MCSLYNATDTEHNLAIGIGLLNESLQLLNLLGSSIACQASSLYKHAHVVGRFMQSDDHCVCKNNRKLR